jgi:hypothetical protein
MKQIFMNCDFSNFLNNIERITCSADYVLNSAILKYNLISEYSTIISRNIPAVSGKLRMLVFFVTTTYWTQIFLNYYFVPKIAIFFSKKDS